MAWLNTDHPIRMSELRGRVVILDFWTYGCINCMHVIPVLRQLEEKRAGQPLEVDWPYDPKQADGIAYPPAGRPGRRPGGPSAPVAGR